MSHNKLTVGTATPDASGALAVDLTDLDDVTNAPTEGEVLGYTSSAWGGAAPPATAQIPFLSWRLLSGSFSTSGVEYDVGDTVIFRNAQFNIYDTTYVTRVASSGPLVPASSTAWSMYYTLKASALQGKTVKCVTSHQARSVTGTDEIVYQWAVSPSTFGTYTPIGPKARQTQDYVTEAYGYYTVGASDINVALMVVDKVGNVQLMTGDNANLIYMHMSIVGE